MTMLVGDIMTRQVVTVSMDAPLAQIRTLFCEHGFHHLVVVDRGRVIGVISDRDMYRNLSPFLGNALMERRQDEETLNRRAHQIMSRKPVVAEPLMTASEAAQRMLDEHVPCLPVVTPEMRLRGIVTWRDLLPYCIACDNAELNPGDEDIDSAAA